MYSSEDLERFYFQCQIEALAHGESLQLFCVISMKSLIIFFQKWFKDNNLVERIIRKLTAQRNNSLHYGNDADIKMVAICHSVIGMVKLHGSSVWNFIGTFSKISLTDAGIMLTWFLTKSLWLPVNVKFKTN